MSNIRCEHCKTEFKTIGSLKKHTINAKYCLKIQGKIDSKTHLCEICSKNFESEHLLLKHLEICKLVKIIDELKKELFEKDNIIKEKDLEILKISGENKILIGKNEVYQTDQQCLHKIAQQTKTSNINNITNNLAIYDAELISNNFRNAINNMTPQDIYGGQSAVAKIIAPCLTNEDGMKMIACTDKSRGVFITKDIDGNISKDLKAKKLVDTIEPIASLKVDEIMNLEKEKVIKCRELFLLRKNINRRLEEIEYLEDTLCGIKKDSNEWNRITKQIENMHDKNNEEYEQVRIYEEEGILEINHDSEVIDSKLINGAIDIKEIKSNSNKFSNTLGSLI